MQVVLVMFRADGARRSFPLTRDVTVIGRREDCDLRIPLTEVSRKHCRIVKDNGSLRVEDLGSSNGTFHNGGRVQESRIEPGDQLQVGPVQFTVQIEGFPPDEMINAPTAAAGDADGSSAGAQFDDSGVDVFAQDATGAQPITAEPSRPPVRSSRPLVPQGDDFAVISEEEETQEQDAIINLQDTSDENKK
jgi:predicted component of type VI protein secretion system